MSSSWAEASGSPYRWVHPASAPCMHELVAGGATDIGLGDYSMEGLQLYHKINGSR